MTEKEIEKCKAEALSTIFSVIDETCGFWIVRDREHKINRCHVAKTGEFVNIIKTTKQAMGQKESIKWGSNAKDGLKALPLEAEVHLDMPKLKPGEGPIYHEIVADISWIKEK